MHLHPRDAASDDTQVWIAAVLHPPVWASHTHSCAEVAAPWDTNAEKATVEPSSEMSMKRSSSYSSDESQLVRFHCLRGHEGRMGEDCG